eukprot:m.607621 g.607621  ORF g.607621 m.607621 type:complete len:173 (+) comp58119_c2_seq35:1192-1710(+)
MVYFAQITVLLVLLLVFVGQLRERIKRDKEKHQLERERLKSMTEAEIAAELLSRAKVVDNVKVKGKFKFLQKYYHRGAFYLDKEEDVLKRDVTLPTLEDHFNKTVLPKVMQVKNFGRHGRTKYTHLLDQDTTQRDAAWAQESTVSAKVQTKMGGMKQTFLRPSAKRKRDGMI